MLHTRREEELQASPCVMSNNTLYQTACIACVYTEEGVFSPSCDVLFSADDLASDHLA